MHLEPPRASEYGIFGTMAQLLLGGGPRPRGGRRGRQLALGLFLVAISVGVHLLCDTWIESLTMIVIVLVMCFVTLNQ